MTVVCCFTGTHFTIKAISQMLYSSNHMCTSHEEMGNCKKRLLRFGSAKYPYRIIFPLDDSAPGNLCLKPKVNVAESRRRLGGGGWACAECWFACHAITDFHLTFAFYINRRRNLSPKPNQVFLDHGILSKSHPTSSVTYIYSMYTDAYPF